MTDSPAKNLADAFQKYIPDDCRFFFAMVERSGNATTLTSIKDPGAVVQFLERLLERAEEREKEKGA